MAKITDYPKVQELVDTNVFILDGDNGTKGILTRDLAKALLASLTTKEIMANVVLSDLDGISSVDAANSLLIGTAAGNKKIAISDAVYAILDPVISYEMRRNIWRGKNLGSVVTSEQYAEIKAGTFRGLFLGDYWIIGGRKWRIVDFNYWIATGDGNGCYTNHLVIMPDVRLYYASMNDTNTTEGGYVGSKMYTTNLTEAKTIINGAFTAAHILSHRELLVNAVNNGPVGGGWFDSTVELPNEIMMYGSYIMTPANDGVKLLYRYTIDKTQLAAMSVDSYLISPNREDIWLRDVVSASDFAAVDYVGNADNTGASYALGVRPVFGLIG